MFKVRYVIKKIGFLFITLFSVLTFNFFLFRILPGDPLRLIARAGNLSSDSIARLNELFGLNQPKWMQYLIYLKNLATGQFGTSITFRRPVIEILQERLLNTAILLTLATIIVVAIGVGAGAIAATRRGSRLDNVFVVTSMVCWSLPTFWAGLILIILLGVSLSFFPIAGISTPGMIYFSSWDRIMDFARHLVLPTITLIIVDMAQFFMITRSALVDVLTTDYIHTAKAKGLSKNRILWKHAFPNALLPIVTATAVYVSLLIGGAIQVETVFSFPGMGKLMYDAVLRRDYPILEASFFIFAVFTILANFISDVIYMIINPRVKNV